MEAPESFSQLDPHFRRLKQQRQSLHDNNYLKHDMASHPAGRDKQTAMKIMLTICCLRSFIHTACISVMAAALVCPAATGQTVGGPLRSHLAEKSRTAFTWKALWVEGESLKTRMHMDLMAQRAKYMGFNVVIAAPSADMVAAVHEHGLQFYALVVNLKELAAADFMKAHPGCLQQALANEEALINTPRENPDRENIQPGPWLCPDFGLLPVERKALETMVKQYELDGVALDNVGYRNYYACFCPYSETARAGYARRHPTLTRLQIMRDFSEQSLVEYVRQAGEVVRAGNPRLKLAIHIDPAFDLNPRYGNKLAVDYCGETIAWCYPPFWDYRKITERTRAFLEAEGEFQGENRFVPFIAVRSGELKKSARRLRNEIRIARSAGTGVIMIGYYEALAENPDLADVVARELRAYP
jgi:hypothetical protein